MSYKGICTFDCPNCPWPDCRQENVSKRDYERNGHEIPWEFTGDQTLTKGVPTKIITTADREAGKALRALRRSKGMNREQLAPTFGIAASTLSQWERGCCPDWGRVKAVFPEFEVELEPPLPVPVMTIKELFESKHTSMHRFGRACGVSAQTVKNWITGKRSPQPANFKEIIKAFPEFIGEKNDS